MIDSPVFQFDQFHFLRPEWFLALLPATLVGWLLAKHSVQTQWHSHIPQHLAKHLLNGQHQVKKPFKWLSFMILVSAITSLAGPVWQKIEKPVFNVKQASVMLLDMSMSVRATDLKPNRLTQMKFKALDLASKLQGSDIALIAYAGDAFVISPLTPDSRNIEALIPSLSPEIMPVPGSYPIMAFEKANELLIQAGQLSGDIYWLTDGIEQEDLDQVKNFLAKTNLTVNILAVGTQQGAPIKLTDGSLLKDQQGSIVLPKTNLSLLADIASYSGGVMSSISATDADINALTSTNRQDFVVNEKDDETDSDKVTTGDDWHEFGPILAVLTLVLMLPLFRRGKALTIVLIMTFGFSSPSPVLAQDEKQPQLASDSLLDKMFNTRDQLGQRAFGHEAYDRAAEAFENPQWKASSLYKAGNYEAALELFQQDASANGFYNQGNALAQLNQFEDAISAYEKALQLQPNHESAKINKSILESAQKEQQENQDNQQQDSDQQGGQDQQSENQNEKENKDQNSQQQTSDENKQQSQQQSDSSSKESNEPKPTDQNEQQNQQSQQSQSGEQSDEQNEQQSQEQQSLTEEQANDDKEKQQAQSQALTPEQIAEQENQQKLQQLLRKVNDDPSVLLRNKMILESRKRQQQGRKPKGAVKSW
jgi:Ca-activated chloride channel family protein